MKILRDPVHRIVSAFRHVRPAGMLPGLLLIGQAMAQDALRPDLEGIWTNASLTNLNRPAGVESLVVSAKEARAIAARTPIGGIE